MHDSYHISNPFFMHNSLMRSTSRQVDNASHLCDIVDVADMNGWVYKCLASTLECRSGGGAPRWPNLRCGYCSQSFKAHIPGMSSEYLKRVRGPEKRVQENVLAALGRAAGGECIYPPSHPFRHRLCSRKVTQPLVIHTYLMIICILQISLVDA